MSARSVYVTDVPIPKVVSTYSNELEVGEFVATAETLKGFLYTGSGYANAVGYVDDPRHLLELSKELRSDCAVTVDIVEEWLLEGPREDGAEDG